MISYAQIAIAKFTLVFDKYYVRKFINLAEALSPHIAKLQYTWVDIGNHVHALTRIVGDGLFEPSNCFIEKTSDNYWSYRCDDGGTKGSGVTDTLDDAKAYVAELLGLSPENELIDYTKVFYPDWKNSDEINEALDPKAAIDTFSWQWYNDNILQLFRTSGERLAILFATNTDYGTMWRAQNDMRHDIDLFDNLDDAKHYTLEFYGLSALGEVDRGKSERPRYRKLFSESLNPRSASSHYYWKQNEQGTIHRLYKTRDSKSYVALVGLHEGKWYWYTGTGDNDLHFASDFGAAKEAVLKDLDLNPENEIDPPISEGLQPRILNRIVPHLGTLIELQEFMNRPCVVTGFIRKTESNEYEFCSREESEGCTILDITTASGTWVKQPYVRFDGQEWQWQHKMIGSVGPKMMAVIAQNEPALHGQTIIKGMTPFADIMRAKLWSKETGGMSLDEALNPDHAKTQHMWMDSLAPYDYALIEWPPRIIHGSLEPVASIRAAFGRTNYYHWKIEKEFEDNPNKHVAGWCPGPIENVMRKVEEALGLPECQKGWKDA